MIAPQPHRVDLRSLAAFRIILSLYILHDIYRRLEHGRLSLAWYYTTTTTTTDNTVSSYFFPSILDEHDTPHGSPIHRAWFYRGSPQFQIFVFSFTILITVLFGLGYQTQKVSILLWLCMNGIQNRSPHLADGSDLYMRNMLLWCCVCDIGGMWSVDAARRRRRQRITMMKKYDVTLQCDQRDDDDKKTNSDKDKTDVITKSGTTLVQRQHSSQKKEISSIAVGSSSSESKDDTPRNNSKDTHQPQSTSSSTIVQSTGALGITLQFVLMYYGALYRRFEGKMWTYPDFNAVYYAMNHNFATRQWAADFLRVNPQMARFMTVGGMIVETFCPLACFLSSCDGVGNSWRHIPAGIIAMFHLSLYACMRLFNWQFISIICCVIWIPPHIWDSFEKSTGLMKVKGMKAMEQNNSSTDVSHQRTIVPTRYAEFIRKFCSSFFLFYMVFNFCGERQWIAKYDNGDIGEFLRFNQNWLMYGPDVDRTSLITLITGTIETAIDVENDKDKVYIQNLPQEHYHLDILKAIRTKDWGSTSEISQTKYLTMKNELPGDMAARYPSWRWEVALNDWVKARVKPYNMTPQLRLRRLGHVLCIAANDELKKRDDGKKVSNVELSFWFAHTAEFGLGTKDYRFDRQISYWDTTVQVECN